MDAPWARGRTPSGDAKTSDKGEVSGVYPSFGSSQVDQTASDRGGVERGFIAARCERLHWNEFGPMLSYNAASREDG